MHSKTLKKILAKCIEIFLVILRYSSFMICFSDTFVLLSNLRKNKWIRIKKNNNTRLTFNPGIRRKRIV